MSKGWSFEGLGMDTKVLISLRSVHQGVSIWCQSGAGHPQQEERGQEPDFQGESRAEAGRGEMGVSTWICQISLQPSTS